MKSLLTHQNGNPHFASTLEARSLPIIVIIKPSYFETTFWQLSYIILPATKSSLKSNQIYIYFFSVRKEADGRGRIPKCSQTHPIPSETFITILPHLYASQLTFSESMIRASLNVKKTGLIMRRICAEEKIFHHIIH